MVYLKRKWILAGVYLLVVVGMLFALYFGSQVVTVISQQIPIERENCIVIDPGHGGIDGGATSCTGVLESHLNLEIALRLNDLFHLLGHQTRMIRSTDCSVYTSGNSIAQKKISDLKQRVNVVNQTPNSILLSIHQNNFTDGQYSGAQVFYAKTGESIALADLLQTSFVRYLNPGSNRKAKQAKGIYLMEHIQCTGILIECGFLSNVREEQLLRTDFYQKKLCAVIAATVCSFLSNT